VLYKAIIWEIKKAFMPKHMVNEPAIWQGARRELLNDKQVRQTALFIGLYMMVFFAGSAILTAYGYTLRESLFEASSALGNVGMSVGVTHPDMPPALFWVQSLLMLLGRLEFFAVIVGVLKLGSDVRKLLGDRD
jgi:trk system potassium uptake protein TrkH